MKFRRARYETRFDGQSSDPAEEGNLDDEMKTRMAAGIKVLLPFSRLVISGSQCLKSFTQIQGEQLFFHFLLVLRFWSGLGKHELD